MAQSSKFLRLDEDILLEFMYHDQNVNYVDDAKIENDDNGSQLKFLNTISGDQSASKFLVHELGADVVNFTVRIDGGYVFINDFASRQLVLKNGKTYKFDLSDSSIDNPSGFTINGSTTNLQGNTLVYTPGINGKYEYSYEDLAGVKSKVGEINVGNRANPLFAEPEQETGNSIKTATGEIGRYYAVPSKFKGTWSLLDNSLDYLTNAEWNGDNTLPVVSDTLVDAVHYETIRLHLRTGFSFAARGKEGFLFQVKVKKATGIYNYFTSIVYLNHSNFEISNPNSFVLGDTSYSKYIQIKVPSLIYLNDSTKNKEFSDEFFGIGNEAPSNTANYEVSYKLINEITDLNDQQYINVEDTLDVTVSREDEYLDISANIEEVADMDYFHVFGTKDGSRQGFENYINNRLESSNDDIIIFHDIEMSEQIGLDFLNTSSMTFTQTANYEAPIPFRPIIFNANIASSFLIRHTMRIYNETDNTQIIKVSTLTSANTKKYGTRMEKINLRNVDPTVIYNKLPNTAVNRELNQFVNSIRPTVGETKYVPVAIDTYGILASASSVGMDLTAGRTISKKLKPEGKETINLSTVSDNFVKFTIAQPDGSNGVKAISLVSAEDLVLIIKSGRTEQRISHDPSFPNVDLGQGEVFFKIPKDTAVRFGKPTVVKATAAKFYINIKNGETQSLLYHGKVTII
jgi:hypothetical protein|tara:strand:+ start:892 stop:2949 length:2058 start_codon:yes stop_codon:yes gene_type:complete